MKIGDVFGRLTVTSLIAKQRFYVCVKCTCGTKKEVRGNHLPSGRIRSCGCLRRELTSARTPALHRANVTHGQSHTRAYRIWAGMLLRCTNENNVAYRYYGGRGIKICRPWKEFENFIADMGQPPLAHTLERRDNNGPYSPRNCFWATRLQQGNNRRTNRHMTFNGETHTITEWARITGIHHNTITQRLDGGASAALALSKERVRTSQINHVIKEKDIPSIRKSSLSLSQLAKAFGTTISNIHAIKHRRSWKHVP